MSKKTEDRRVDPASPLGVELRYYGVDLRDFRARFVVWPFGGALTAPVPGRVYVFIPRAWQNNHYGYGYAYRHEFVHVAQARRWGIGVYWLRHIWARIVTRSMLAKSDPVEREAYDAEHAFRTS